MPHRGGRCEPAFTADTARFIAELRGESFDELATFTRQKHPSNLRTNGRSALGICHALPMSDMRFEGDTLTMRLEDA